MASRPIDEKIVAMKMDNSDFKNKAIETTSLFGKLKQSLANIPTGNFGKVSNDIGNIQRNINGVDFSTMASSIDTISNRFTTMGIIATTALQNITNRAVDAGINMYRSLNVAPITAGFNEYETKMKSIGTVLSNTEWAGTTLSDVKKTLGELNDYADNTIYSFEQMTANVGRFTAAGVTLEDSAIAIKGLGNLAAISGSDVNQLNTAMYQMSQALASGKLNLMDWNSLVNAGMAGKKTQDALVATARAMGKNVDMSEGFRNSIEQGWLTSEVFLETLKQFGQDESMTKAATSVRTFTGMMDALKEGIGSGWATTWELIFGDFEVATKRWTAVSNVLNGFFQKQSDTRNKFIKSLADVGVFQTFFDAFVGVGNAVVKVTGAILGGFSKAFSVINLVDIKGLASDFKDFAVSLKPSEETMEKISIVAQSVGSNLAMLIGVIKTVSSTFINLIPDGIGPMLLNMATWIAKLNLTFNDSITSGEKATESIGGLTGVIASMGVGVANSVKMMTEFGDKVAEVWEILGSGKMSSGSVFADDSTFVKKLLTIRQAAIDIGKYVSEINISFTPVIETFNSFFTSLSNGFKWIGKKIGDFKDAIVSMLPSGDQLLAGGFVAAMVAIVGKTVLMAQDIFSMFTGWGPAVEGITDILDNVAGALKAFTMQVYSQALINVAIAVGILSVSFLLLSRLDGMQIATGLYAIVGSLSGLMAAMAIISKYDLTGSGMKTAILILGMAAAFSIMAVGIRKLSDLSWDQIAKGTSALAIVMFSLAGALGTMSTLGSGKMQASALQLVGIAAAVLLMSSAIEGLAKLDGGMLAKGLTVMGILLIEMALFLKIAGGSKFGIGSTLGMLAMGKAIENMAEAIGTISKLNVGQLSVGLSVITLILAELAIFSLLTKRINLFSVGAGMLMLSLAINALIIPIAILGNMELSTLATGITAMGVALISLGLATKALKGSLTAGLSIAMIAGALMLLLIPLTSFSALGWGVILGGLGMITISLTALSLVSLLLAPATGAIAALGGAITLLSVGLLAGGLGVTLFAGGLMTLATLTTGAVVSIVAGIGTLIVGLASLIPTAVNFIANLLIKIAEAMLQYLPVILDVVGKMVIKIIQWMTDFVPKFIDVAVKFVVALLDGLGKAFPTLISAGVKFMADFVLGLASAIRNEGTILIDAIMTLIAEVIILVVEAGVRVIDALFGWIPGVSGATAKISETANDVIREQFKAVDIGKEKGKDFANSLASTSGNASSSGAKVASAAQTAASGINIGSVGASKGVDFANSLASKTGSASIAGIDIAKAGKSGAASISMADTGKWFGEGFASGIGNSYSKVVESAKSLARSAKKAVSDWLDINSPSRVMRADGGWFGEGFALGIADQTKNVAGKAKGLATTAKDSVNKFIDGLEVPEVGNEVHFKAVIDYDKLDVTKFGRGALTIQPDTSLTNSLASTSIRKRSQNDNINGSVDNSTSTTSNVYNINVEAKGVNSRSEIKKIAEQVQTELKNIQDRKKMSRGEGVVF